MKSEKTRAFQKLILGSILIAEVTPRVGYLRSLLWRSHSM